MGVENGYRKTVADGRFSFPLFGQQMYDKLGYGWGNSLLGFLALVIGVPFPIFIFRVFSLITLLVDDSTAHD